MSEIVVAQRMWQRRDTAANWTAVNPVLNAGEIGVELGSAPVKFKIGDGTTAWSALLYQGGGAGNALLTTHGAPSNSTGVDGDYAIDPATSMLYGPKAAGAWPAGVSLIGPTGATGAAGAPGATGPAGPAGANGTNGTDGFSVLTGVGAPAAGLGIDGDFYIDNSAKAIYGPKTGGAWGSATSLVGPQGPAGTDAPSVTRQTITLTSATGARVTGTAAMGKMVRILRIDSNNPLRLRLYATAAERDADVSRLVSVDPPAGSGLQFEAVTTGALAGFDLGPTPHAFNNEATITNAIAYTLDPTNAVSTSVTLTYMVIQP